jgi:hypothetical protein
VRDEDLDWEIYHALLDGKARTTGDLVAAGYDPLQIEGSLARLENSCLIERQGDAVRILSVQESILLCQVKNAKESPLCFENGVIRLKTEQERKRG